MRKITLPDWVKKLPDNARLRANEVKAIFGYSETTGGQHSGKEGIPAHPYGCRERFHRQKLPMVSSRPKEM